LPGDRVLLHEGEPASVRVEVLGGEGRMLRLLGEHGVLHESLILSERQVVEYQVRDTFVLPGYIRAELIAPLDPEVDLATEPGALWVDALTNPVYFRLASLEPRAEEA
jgi:hypothetical protein